MMSSSFLRVVLYFAASFVSESPFTTVYAIVCGGAVFVALIVTPGEGVDVTTLVEAGVGATGTVGVVAVCAGSGRSASARANMEPIETVNFRFFMEAVRA